MSNYAASRSWPSEQEWAATKPSQRGIAPCTAPLIILRTEVPTALPAGSWHTTRAENPISPQIYSHTPRILLDWSVQTNSSGFPFIPFSRRCWRSPNDHPIRGSQRCVGWYVNVCARVAYAATPMIWGKALYGTSSGCVPRGTPVRANPPWTKWLPPFAEQRGRRWIRVLQTPSQATPKPHPPLSALTTWLVWSSGWRTRCLQINSHTARPLLLAKRSKLPALNGRDLISDKHTGQKSALHSRLGHSPTGLA